MIFFKFTKTGSAAYIPHLDTARAIMRSFVRADIGVKHSQGFNPHPLMYFSPPIPLGVESLCEYCAADADIAPDKFLSAFNDAAVPGIRAVKAASVTCNPNVAKIGAFAEYDFVCGDCSGVLAKIDADKAVVVEKRNSKPPVMIDIYPGIYSHGYADGRLRAILASGNNANVRPDVYVSAITQSYGKITKKRLFCMDGNVLTDIDTLLALGALSID